MFSNFNQQRHSFKSEIILKSRDFDCLFFVEMILFRCRLSDDLKYGRSHRKIHEKVTFGKNRIVWWEQDMSLWVILFLDQSVYFIQTVPYLS